MDITMPQLGETVTEGTITRWLKQIGDRVEVDQPLFEVSTDKVDSEVPAPSAGYLSEIRVPEGETAAVGTVLAVIGDAPSRRRADLGGRARAQSTSRRPHRRAHRRPRTRRRRRRAHPSRRRQPPVTRRCRASPNRARPSSLRRRPSARAAAASGAALTSPVVRRLIAEHGLDAAPDPRHRRGRAHHAQGRARRRSRAGGPPTAAPPVAPPRPPPPAARAAGRAPPRRAAGAAAPSPRRRSPSRRSWSPPAPEGRAVSARPAHVTAAREDRRTAVCTRAPGSACARATAHRRRPRRPSRLRPRSPRAWPIRSSRSRTSVDAPRSTCCARRRRARTPTRRPRSTSSGSPVCGTIGRPTGAPARASRSRILPFVARAFGDVVQQYPHVNATVGDDALIVHRTVHLGHRRRPRLPGPRRARHPQRRREAPPAARARDPRPRRPGPRQAAAARRGARRRRSRSPTRGPMARS